MVSLRAYQTRAIDETRARVAAGMRRVLVVSPTGSGKSLIAAAMARSALARHKRVLFTAHRRELIQQAFVRFVAMGIPEDQMGVIMAGDARVRPNAPVQLASVATLRGRATPRADVLLIDEAHHAVSTTHADIAAAYPDAVHVGFTATTFRADRRSLKPHFDALVLVAQPKELIAEGHILEPRVFTVPPTEMPDLRGVRVVGGDYDERALAQAMDKGALVGNIVEHWKRIAGGARTIAFAVSIAHSQHIVARFVAAGIPAEHVDGNTPNDERSGALERLVAGETLVLSNVAIFTEGTDLPAAKCAILARPTKSTGLYLQQVGRVLRPWNGARALVLDHGGCVHAHGLPQEDREFSLDGIMGPGPARQAAGPRLQTCLACFAIAPGAALTCPECEQAFEAKTHLLEEATGSLVEMGEADFAPQREAWRRLCLTAQVRGYKPGWAHHRFKAQFGVPAPSSFVPIEIADAERALFDDILAHEDSRAWAVARYRAEAGKNPPC